MTNASLSRIAGKLLPIAGLLIAAAALQSCDRSAQERSSHGSSATSATTRLEWTKAAADRNFSSHKPYALPQIRVYDGRGQLVLNLTRGASASNIASQVDQAIRADRSVPGPTVAETLADLQTYDGQPALSAVKAQGRPLLVDYWASWCIPCKAVGKALLAWSAQKPPGSVQIAQAETDLVKAAEAHGIKIERYKQVKGPDGKLHLVHVA